MRESHAASCRHRLFCYCVGDLLRAEVERGGPEAEQLQRIMKEGQLVPDSTMITLLKVRDSPARPAPTCSSFAPTAGRLSDLWVSNKHPDPCCLFLFVLQLADRQRRQRRVLGMR